MSFVMCHMSYVTYHMSHVTCPMLQLVSYLILYMYIYLFYVYIFGWQVGGTTWWRVCYKLSVSSSFGLSDISKINFFYYLLHGILAYSHILLCHCGDSRIHQTTEIGFFVLFSFILIALSSTAITIRLSACLCGNLTLSQTCATSSATCFAFTHVCIVLCHSPLSFLTSVRYW